MPRISDIALQAAIRREEDRQIIASQDAEYEAIGLPTVEFFKLPAVTRRGKLATG